MALIECPECKGQVSDTAKSCPHCGYPLAATEQNAASATEAPATENAKGDIFALWKNSGDWRAKVAWVLKKPFMRTLFSLLGFIFIAITIIIMYAFFEKTKSHPLQAILQYNDFKNASTAFFVLAMIAFFVNTVSSLFLSLSILRCGDWARANGIDPIAAAGLSDSAFYLKGNNIKIRDWCSNACIAKYCADSNLRAFYKKTAVFLNLTFPLILLSLIFIFHAVGWFDFFDNLLMNALLSKKLTFFKALSFSDDVKIISMVAGMIFGTVGAAFALLSAHSSRKHVNLLKEKLFADQSKGAAYENAYKILFHKK